jgi:hypothetical protein
MFLAAAEASIRETTSRPFVIHMRDAESMQPPYRRDAGVWNQTKSLLYKNVLIKWRTKQQSLQVGPGSMLLAWAPWMKYGRNKSH